MPEINYYDDVKVIKKPIRKRLKQILIFLLVVLTIVGCFVSATYLSSALTVGNLGAFVVYGDTALKINKSSLYAVTMGEYSDKSEAEKVALGASIQGASGYIWEDNNYFVIGNIYSANEDALKVVENLKTSSYNVAVKEINFPKVTLDFSMYENSDMGIVKKAINAFDETYELLYESSIKLDKSEITNLAVSSGLSEMRGEIKALIVSVQNLINKSDSDLSLVQSALIKTDELLDQTIIKTIDSGSANYSLKYAISSVIRFKYDLFQELV